VIPVPVLIKDLPLLPIWNNLGVPLHYGAFTFGPFLPSLFYIALKNTAFYLSFVFCSYSYIAVSPAPFNPNKIICIWVQPLTTPVPQPPRDIHPFFFFPQNDFSIAHRTLFWFLPYVRPPPLRFCCHFAILFLRFKHHQDHPCPLYLPFGLLHNFVSPPFPDHVLLSIPPPPPRDTVPHFT